MAVKDAGVACVIVDVAISLVEKLVPLFKRSATAARLNQVSVQIP